MAVEYRGAEFLYLVQVPGSEDFRLFNQTDGSRDREAAEIELDTKDKTGADYGAITQTISIEGIITEGDDALDYIEEAQLDKKFVRIIEVNTRNMTTQSGAYMITSISNSYSNGEYATYTIDATLNGSITKGTLDVLPDGAPDEEIDLGEDGDGGSP